MLGRIAMQRMHRARLIILLGFRLRLVVNRLSDFRPIGALHPRRRARGRAVLRRSAVADADRDRAAGAPRGCTFGLARPMPANGSVWPISRASSAKGSLVALGRHRAAAEKGLSWYRSAIVMMRPLREAPTRCYQRIGPCQMPSQIPIRECRHPCHISLPQAYRISVGALTPRMASPDARTETTPWTIASRAFVISASLLIMKRK